jgi:mutator protein MutT
MRQTTLCFLLTDKEICLATKKTGMGTGNLNGYGGKLEPGETIEEAAVRETEEEIGVKIAKEDLEPVAAIKFYFFNKPEWDQEMRVFLARRWMGEPTESDEMRPEWVSLAAIPYDKMWADDTYWLPKVLAGKKIEAEFYFKEDHKQIVKFELKEI